MKIDGHCSLMVGAAVPEVRCVKFLAVIYTPFHTLFRTVLRPLTSSLISVIQLEAEEVGINFLDSSTDYSIICL